MFIVVHVFRLLPFYIVIDASQYCLLTSLAIFASFIMQDIRITFKQLPKSLVDTPLKSQSLSHTNPHRYLHDPYHRLPE